MQSHTPNIASNNLTVTTAQQWQAYINNVMQSKQRYLNLVSNQFMHRLALTNNWSISAPIDLDQGPIRNIDTHDTTNATDITDIPHYIVSRKTPLNATKAANLKWRGARSDDTDATMPLTTLHTLLPAYHTWAFRLNAETPLNATKAANLKWRGARSDDTDATMPLTTLHTLLPAYHTWAFRLNAENFGFVIIDIEETATPEEIDLWLSMPYLYAEHSMSGKGIHLVVDAAILETSPSWMDFMALPKIQSHDRHVEILMRNHWVTFTGNTLPTPANPNGNTSVLTTLFNHLVDEHGKQISARNGALDNVDIGTLAYNTVSSTALDNVDIGTLAYNTVSSTQVPYEDIIIPQTIMSLQHTVDMQARLDAVGHDMSRYEYGILCTIKRELIRVLHSSNAATKARYDDEAMARLIWRTLYGILCTIKRELIRVLHSSNAATKARYDDEAMARLIWRTLCWRTMEHVDPDTGEVTPVQNDLPGIDHVVDYRDKWALRRPGGTYITMQIKKVVSNSGEELILTNIEQELLEYNLSHPDHHIEYNDTGEPPYKTICPVSIIWSIIVTNGRCAVLVAHISRCRSKKSYPTVARN